ncbi:AbfB domain-containing protein [Streptomyces sp. NPDC004561]
MSAGYGGATGSTGTPSPGSEISLRATTSCCTTDYVRHQTDGTAQFRADATFCPGTGKSGTGASFASYDYPTRYPRHYDYGVYIASDGGANALDSGTSWADDVSWAVSGPWAP